MLLECVDFETERKINRLSAFYKDKSGDIPVKMGILISCLEDLVKKEIEVKEYFSEDTNNKGYLWPFIYPEEVVFHIRFNTFLDPYEQRLVITHEIAHILFSFTEEERPQRKRPLIVKNRCLYPAEEEDICDEIAMYLLCPPDEIEKFLRNFNYLPYQLSLFGKNHPDLMRLKEMTKKFEVPLKDLIKHIKKQYQEVRIKDVFAKFNAA